MADKWPPALKTWVAKCLGEMTDSNRKQAETEMKDIIRQACEKQTLWTTDWTSVQLQSVISKPLVLSRSFATPAPPSPGMKRKLDGPSPAATKKAKKSALGKSAALVDPADHAALNRRAQRFQREHEIERNRSAAPAYSSSSHYQYHYGPPPSDAMDVDPAIVPDWDRFTIVGTNQEVFKDYLRLTSEPKPEQIRPYAVLQQTLQELKKKWKDKAPYNWVCNQFKSLRQDLTVQRIKNEFTVQVYEIHTRMALEMKDDVECHSCLGQLKLLYEQGIPGKVEEFTAYHILQLIRARDRSSLNMFVAQLTPSQKSSRPISHALSVQRALSMGNYHQFFQLYIDAPNMAGYVMDRFVDRERVKALMIISRSYQRTPISFLAAELGFNVGDDDKSEAENLSDAAKDVVAFLAQHNAAFFVNPNAPDSDKILECKPCHDPLAKVFEEKYRKASIEKRV